METMKRIRTEANRQAKQGKQPRVKSIEKLAKSVAKQFNLNTPKFHLAGHYVATIKTFGTTDSYSTAIVHFIH